MWAKLGNEVINLDSILRVKFTKSWTREGDCLVAEVEALEDGELKQIIRYRGAEAEILQAALQLQTVEVVLPEKAPRMGGRPTMHEMSLDEAKHAMAKAEVRSHAFPTLADI